MTESVRVIGRETRWARKRRDWQHGRQAKNSMPTVLALIKDQRIRLQTPPQPKAAEDELFCLDSRLSLCIHKLCEVAGWQTTSACARA